MHILLANPAAGVLNVNANPIVGNLNHINMGFIMPHATYEEAEGEDSMRRGGGLCHTEEVIFTNPFLVNLIALPMMFCST